MKPFLHLEPDQELPAWIQELETATFGKPWGDLDDGDQVWAIAPCGFIRWQVIAAAQEAELIRLAVGPAWRRVGHGEALLRHSQARLAAMGVASLFLEVRVGNLSARLLYEKAGWVFTGLRPGYYRDGEDAALYRCDLAKVDGPEPPRPA